MSKAREVVLYKWDEVEDEALTPLFNRKMVHGERIMLAHIHMKKGSIVPLHHHDNEQFSYILNGKMRFWYGEEDALEEVVIQSGEVLHLPSNVPHKAEALVDTLSLDVFSPPREDWIGGTDAYLRRQK